MTDLISFDFNQINHLRCLAVETFPKSLEGVYYFISYTANILDVILLIKSDFFEAIRLISKVSSQFMAYLLARSRTDQSEIVTFKVSIQKHFIAIDFSQFH